VLGDSLAQVQLGVGTSGNCEAAVHATRRFLANMPDDHVIVKSDFSNAFKNIRRDAVLMVIADQLPEIYRFYHLAYQNTSLLKYGSEIVDPKKVYSRVPLLFCLTIQPLLKLLESNLALGYLEDVTLGGQLSTVASDVAIIVSKGASLGLGLNPSKCEVISNSGTISHPQFAGYRQVPQSSATLLGSPLSSGLVMDSALFTMSDDCRRAVERLSLIFSQDTLILLKRCLGGPKLQYVLRPCCDHPLLCEFDDLLRTAVTKMCNVTLSDDQWTQARLPVRCGWSGSAQRVYACMIRLSSFSC